MTRDAFLFTIPILFLGLLFQPNVIASDSSLGVATCRHCHPTQFEAWKNGPHSNSLFVLELDSRKDPKCIGCHSSKIEGELENVQCESCHGGGANYAKSYIMKDRELAKALGLKVNDFSVCLICHQGNSPKIRTFDEQVFWKRLPHCKTSAKQASTE